MAQTPFSALPALAPATPASGDELAIVDVSAGTLNNVTLAEIAANMPAITTPSVTGPLVGNADTATKLAAGHTIAITGDVAYASPAFDGSGNVTAAGTLATVNSNVGTFGDASHSPTVTVNAKGLVTAASQTAITADASTLTGNTLASGVTASSLTSLGTIAALVATKLKSTSGSTSVPNATATTLVTMTAAGCYFVATQVSGTAVGGVAFVMWDGTSAAALALSGAQGGVPTFSVSGAAIQVTQATGSTRTFGWTLVAIA